MLNILKLSSVCKVSQQYNILTEFTVVIVSLEHSHSFIDSFDHHSTASGHASCRLRRPPGNAVNGHS